VAAGLVGPAGVALGGLTVAVARLLDPPHQRVGVADPGVRLGVPPLADGELILGERLLEVARRVGDVAALERAVLGGAGRAAGQEQPGDERCGSPAGERSAGVHAGDTGARTLRFRKVGRAGRRPAPAVARPAARRVAQTNRMSGAPTDSRY